MKTSHLRFSFHNNLLTYPKQVTHIHSSPKDMVKVLFILFSKHDKFHMRLNTTYGKVVEDTKKKNLPATVFPMV